VDAITSLIVNAGILALAAVAIFLFQIQFS
jgi:hypothetical protein